jgi:hypothetical protein
MGIGSYPCGTGPCGFDPVAAPSARETLAGSIPYYDPAVRGFATLSNGDLRSVHPVIQEASFSLGVKLGDIPSAPTVGLNVKRILTASADSLQRVAEDEVAIALRRLLDAKDLVVKRVQTARSSGYVQMEVEIVNLRDPGNGNTTIRGVL